MMNYRFTNISPKIEIHKLRMNCNILKFNKKIAAIFKAVIYNLQ